MTFCYFETVIFWILFISVTGFSGKSCVSEFKDVASRTVLADIVFEGQAAPPSSPRGRFNVTFHVKKVFKGALEQRAKDQYRPISVGTFGEEEDPDVCVSGPVISGSKYIVFLGNESVSSGEGNRKYYVISSFPVAVTKQVVKNVQSHACANCGKLPTARLTPNKPTRVKIDQKSQITCNFQGKPSPMIIWFKDSQSLRTNDRIQLKQSRKFSRITIKKMAKEDGGFYECQAVNALGASTKVGVNITTALPSKDQTKPPKSHTTPCAESTFCFNGGSCYLLPQLGRKFCKCSLSFQGDRCQEKRIDIGRKTEGDESTLICVVVIAGAVVGLILVFACGIVFCVFTRRTIRQRRLKQSIREVRGHDVTFDVTRDQTDIVLRQNTTSQQHNKHDSCVQTEARMPQGSELQTHRECVVCSNPNGKVMKNQQRNDLTGNQEATSSRKFEISEGLNRNGNTSSSSEASDADSGEYFFQLVTNDAASRNGVPSDPRSIQPSPRSDWTRNARRLPLPQGTKAKLDKPLPNSYVLQATTVL